MFFITSLLCINTMYNCTVNAQTNNSEQSPARIWIDAYLETIKLDGLGPTIHARNLHHISAAMYDVWTVYNPGKGSPFFLGNTKNNFEFEFDGFEIPENRDSAQFVSICYAAYRLINHRINNYSSKGRTVDKLIFLMEDLGLNPNYSDADYSNGSAAGLGNYIADQIFEFGLTESAGDEDGYEGPGFNPRNPPLKPNEPGNPDLINPNNWQPLAIRDYINAKGEDESLEDWNYQLIEPVDNFLTPHWGEITPFAMTKDERNQYADLIVYNDPGPPPYIKNENTESQFEAYLWNFALVGSWSGQADPSLEEFIDISPGSIGSTKGMLPTSLEEYQSFFDFENGGTKSKANKRNPYSNKSYDPNIVNKGDYTRVIAEYWVDAVNTYSPPGHWVKMLNDVTDNELFIKKWKGKGKLLTNLEWDVKSYLTLTGALHDAAISAWSVKTYYNYIRPISAIRWMADQGQSTDSLLPNYHPLGLPLMDGRFELVKKDDPLAGEQLEHLNKIKMKSWRGPDYINDPKKDVSGVDWILAENWWPYQRYSFTTPPFAGYVSGHSTFSIAAAEVLELITGSPYFPGGLLEESIKKNEFLEFENGPSQDITLQWATYREAADETCLSRIWGGIHPPVDDIEGRKIGMKVATQSFELVQELFKN